jgi:L-fuculose-phosphate aldolase
MNLPAPITGGGLAPFGNASHADENDLRRLICEIGRLMHDGGYVAGYVGGISARLDAARILIAPPGLAKGFMQPEHLLTLDLAADISAPDLLLHAECYRGRPAIGGLIHAAPPHALALTLAGITMRACVLPEAVIFLGLVPTAGYTATPHEAARVLMAQHDAMLIAHWGAVTAGADVWQAYLRLEMLEHTAGVLHRTAQLGPIAPLPPEEAARLLSLRKARGYWLPGDDERFREMCGACD